MERWFVWWLIFIFFTDNISVAVAQDDVPCSDNTWQYSDVGGKCYKFIGKDKRLTWAEASIACSSALSTVSTQPVQLIQFTSEDELHALIAILLRMGNMEPIWLGAHRELDQLEFRWQNSTDSIKLDFLEWSGGMGAGQCLELSYLTTISPSAVNWKADVTVQETDCKTRLAFVCEHSVPVCHNPPGGFDETTMRFIPSKPYPRKVVLAVCQEGSYMTSTTAGTRVTGPNVNDSLQMNEYYCHGQKTTAISDPMQYRTEFKYSGFTVTECQRLQCDLYPSLLENVENVPSLPAGSNHLTYEFREVVEFKCKHGYVSPQNSSSIESQMECLQTDPQSTEGVWIPEHHHVCVAVRCDLDALKKMVPQNGMLSSARNYNTDRVYAQHQVNEFNYFGNVITVRCLPGYLFPDRTVEKFLTCVLAEGSQTEGIYKGYGGTVLPIPNACEATTCMYENAVIKSDFNMLPYFLVQNGTGDWVNLTKHEGKPYALNAKIRYFCADGYETVNQNQDFNITCSDTGLWSPQLIGCIAKTAELPSSNTGRFHTDPEEAASAKQISSIMFILIFIFLGFIILLDLTTVGRDAKQLWSNVKLQQKRFARKSHENRSDSHRPSIEEEDAFGAVRNRNG